MGSKNLHGIKERLSHLVDLGVDAIWLSPIFVSPMTDFSDNSGMFVELDPQNNLHERGRGEVRQIRRALSYPIRKHVDLWMSRAPTSYRSLHPAVRYYARFSQRTSRCETVIASSNKIYKI